MTADDRLGEALSYRRQQVSGLLRVHLPFRDQVAGRLVEDLFREIELIHPIRSGTQERIADGEGEEHVGVEDDAKRSREHQPSSESSS